MAFGNFAFSAQTKIRQNAKFRRRIQVFFTVCNLFVKVRKSENICLFLKEEVKKKRNPFPSSKFLSTRGHWCSTWHHHHYLELRLEHLYRTGQSLERFNLGLMLTAWWSAAISGQRMPSSSYSGLWHSLRWTGKLPFGSGTSLNLLWRSRRDHIRRSLCQEVILVCAAGTFGIDCQASPDNALSQASISHQKGQLLPILRF